jgi:hypothetical protein
MDLLHGSIMVVILMPIDIEIRVTNCLDYLFLINGITLKNQFCQKNNSKINY